MVNITKKIVYFVVDCWRIIMDNRYNPLRFIADPSIQAYFTMALFVMWSAYFGIVAAYYLEWMNYSIVTSIWVHLAVVIPIMITNATFRQAEKDGRVWVKDYTDRKVQAHINNLPERREDRPGPDIGVGKFDKQRVHYSDGDNT